MGFPESKDSCTKQIPCRNSRSYASGVHKTAIGPCGPEASKLGQLTHQLDVYLIFLHSWGYHLELRRTLSCCMDCNKGPAEENHLMQSCESKWLGEKTPASWSSSPSYCPMARHWRNLHRGSGKVPRTSAIVEKGQRHLYSSVSLLQRVSEPLVKEDFVPQNGCCIGKTQQG